ncbi:MAG: peptidoglycan-associated lipoprotein Pal [Acidobacteriota bacterium]
MRHGSEPITRIATLLAIVTLAAGGCRTVPDTEGVSDSAPPAVQSPGPAETVTDPFGPAATPPAREAESALDETDFTGEEIGPGEAAGDPRWAEARMESVYFEFDRAALTDDARNSLDRNAAFLKEYPALKIRIEGHCDERGTTEYNLALGDRRANTVKEYLVQKGLERTRFEVVSFGEERPADPGHSTTAWARNRRAEFHVR